MDRTRRLIIVILVVILIGLIAIIAGALFMGHESELTHGNKNILVCAIDESESRPGMGACDMAFIVNLQDGTLKNYTPFYPGDMTHPTASEPKEAQDQGAGSALLLHDAFWDADNEIGMQYAKEIVEANTNFTPDAVVVVYDEGVDNVINTIRPLTVNGEVKNISAADIIRENDAYAGYEGNEDVTGTMSRGDAVMELVKALAEAAADPAKKAKMADAALQEYNKGNIIMQPEGSFTKLLATKGIETIGK